jgi:transaldolase
MSTLNEYFSRGQSIWYDFISRDFIASGEMKRLVDLGVRGMTSNPTIFEKAIAGGTDYDEQIASLAAGGAGTDEIATAIFVQDIQAACDLIKPVYEESNGNDGFISLEVSPDIAHDTGKTIDEAKRLWAEVDRPNLMVKIPATPAGYPAIQEAIAAGLNINITLIFSVEQYEKVVAAVKEGLSRRIADGQPVDRIRSVASVFISRIDSMVDGLLEALGGDVAERLAGKAGLANATLIYEKYLKHFSGEEWRAFEEKGAARQRPLWASTSTKNPDYPDLLYVDNLIATDTVNTVPPATLTAMLDHGSPGEDIHDFQGAADTLKQIHAAGIDLDHVMEDLLEQGVTKFADSFGSLYRQIEEKSARLESEQTG